MQLIQKRIDLIKNLPGRPIGVEVGVQRGYFSIEILNDANVGKLFLVDVWKKQGFPYVDDDTIGDPDDNLRLTKHHIAGHVPGGRVEIIQGMSVDVATNWKGPKIDFAYIDADHSYEACLADLEAWFKLLTPTGVLMGHDYCETGHGFTWGVIPAVAEFCTRHNWEIAYLTAEETPSFLIRRRA